MSASGSKSKTPEPEEANSSPPAEDWFFGWCYIDHPPNKPHGEWKYIDEEVQWPPLLAKVVHFPSSTADDKAPWKGVIKSYDAINGYRIEGTTLADGDWKEQTFLALDVERLYICCDYYGNPKYAAPI